MACLQTELKQQLNHLGLRQVDVPIFINDIECLAKDYENLSYGILNHELEELGWGVEIVDRDMFKSILMVLSEKDHF